MPTIDQVHTAIRTRLEANFTELPLRFQDTVTPLPNTPVAFAYVELVLENYGFIAYGGGLGRNLQRTTGHIEAHVMTPIGSEEREDALAWGEQICAVFRGDGLTDGVSYTAAQVVPVNGRSEDGNHDHICSALIDLHFDMQG